MRPHVSRLHANQTDQECGFIRSESVEYVGDGCCALLDPLQLADFSHRVRMYAHMSRRSPSSVVHDVGLRGEAAAQVLAVLDAE